MPTMSFGSFATHFTVVDRYGMPWQVSPKSMMMDIDRYFTLSIDRNNDAAKTIQFRAASGARMSANEHWVPEALFDDPNTTTKEVEGVSAVKALAIASQQGQKIYTINQTNINQVLPLLRHKAAVIQDVQDAVAAGKIVTISERMISANGWTGSGYIIVDPLTGAGAYLIGGAADGAVMAMNGVIMIMAVLVAVLAGGVASLIVLSGLLVAGVGSFLAGMGVILNDNELCQRGVNTLLAGLFASVGVPALIVKYNLLGSVFGRLIALIAATGAFSFVGDAVKFVYTLPAVNFCRKVGVKK